MGEGYYLSEDEPSVTTESALLGDLFQKYVSYILLATPPEVLNEEQNNVTSFPSLGGMLSFE